MRSALSNVRLACVRPKRGGQAGLLSSDKYSNHIRGICLVILERN